jgi:hypothetical protein
MLLQGQRDRQAVLQLAATHPEKGLFTFVFIKPALYQY